ncbi:MAG: hypothetical protein IJU54_01420 [Alphaproteobacteria bacterium]|nr:hypothetical protein [Alphaproteobacteria bacterium]
MNQNNNTQNSNTNALPADNNNIINNKNINSPSNAQNETQVAVPNNSNDNSLPEVSTNNQPITNQ